MASIEARWVKIYRELNYGKDFQEVLRFQAGFFLKCPMLQHFKNLEDLFECGIKLFLEYGLHGYWQEVVNGEERSLS